MSTFQFRKNYQFILLKQKSCAFKLDTCADSLYIMYKNVFINKTHNVNFANKMLSMLSFLLFKSLKPTLDDLSIDMKIVNP